MNGSIAGEGRRVGLVAIAQWLCLHKRVLQRWRLGVCLHKRVSQRWRLDYAYTRGLKLSIYKRVMQRWVIHLQEGNAEIGSGSVVYLYRSC